MIQLQTEAPVITMGKATRRRVVLRQRGIYERIPGSEIWWIRYADSTGRIHREKAGSKSGAIKLYQKRKTDALQERKLPETLKKRVVRFSELAGDALKYVKNNNEGHQVDAYRIACLDREFGNGPAEIPIHELRQWFDDQEWKAETENRIRTVLSLIYRLGMENKKVESNPAKLLKHKREDNGRVRFLNQFQPVPTDVDFLRQHRDEESRLRAVIRTRYAIHMPELDIALNTGMRRKEQYWRIDWSGVDLLRRDLYIPPSKNGESRHVPLNTDALAAFQELWQRTGGKGPIFVSNHGERLLGLRHWFEDAVKEAGIQHFTWHDLRHTFASRLVMAGVDLRTVAGLMGHKHIQMTMRYSHLAPAHTLAAVERLALFNPSKKSNNQGEESAKLISVPEGATGTKTGTSQNEVSEITSPAVQ